MQQQQQQQQQQHMGHAQQGAPIQVIIYTVIIIFSYEHSQEKRDAISLMSNTRN